jgi:hypothetical protein
MTKAELAKQVALGDPAALEAYEEYRKAIRYQRRRETDRKNGRSSTDMSQYNRAKLEGIRAYLSATRPHQKHSCSMMADDTLVEVTKKIAIPEGIMTLTADDRPNQPQNWIVLEECRIKLKKKYPSQVDFIDGLGPELLSMFQRHPEYELLEVPDEE